MIYKVESPLSGHIRIIFELPSSVWANRVNVCGDFNDWNRHNEPLRQERDGCWRAVLDLPVNRQFRFHYLVDGNELLDCNADGLSNGSFQEQKSIVSTKLTESAETVQHRRPLYIKNNASRNPVPRVQPEPKAMECA